MSGFVDVSNMSDIEIKRLGQIDDAGDAWSNPYAYRNLARRNPYSYRKPMQKTTITPLNYKAEDVWSAAWQAYVLNGKQYVKVVVPGVANHKTNRMIVEELLANTTLITQESRDMGETMQRYFMGLTFKMIEGKALSEFMQGAYDAATKHTITTKLELAIIASLPATYEKSSKRDEADRKVNFARGGYVGNVGDKVSLNIEVVKSVWSQKWNTWYITGITGEDQAVFFGCKENFDAGTNLTITGNVKGTRDNSTQLNRVKVL